MPHRLLEVPCPGREAGQAAHRQAGGAAITQEVVRNRGGGGAIKDREQYLALLEAVGTHKTARQMMHIIKWRSNPSPPETPNILDRWEDEWTAGFHEVPAKDVRKMRQRLMAYEEWENRRMIGKYRDAAREFADMAIQRIKDGKEVGEDRVLAKYFAEQVGFNTQATSNAHGTPKVTDTARSGMKMKKPKALSSPKQLPEQAPINAEFRVVDATDN